MRLIALLICVSLCSCLGNERWKSVTASEATPRMEEITKIIKDRCAEIGEHPWVTFTDDKYIVTYMGDEASTAAMWVSGGEVFVWTGILDYSDDLIDAYARHECCHLALGHDKGNGTPEKEIEADACAVERYAR